MVFVCSLRRNAHHGEVRVAVLMWWWLVVGISSKCNNTGAVSLPSQYQIYSQAKSVTLTQQQQILTAYSTLSTLQNYTISLSNFSIYINKLSTCDKKQAGLSSYNSQADIWLCFDEFYLLECNSQWQLVLKCGTFVQFHKPFNPEILIEMDLGEAAWLTDSNGLAITNAVVQTLCAGLYHLWFVYYARAGKFIRGVKTLYIATPNCNC